MKRKKFNLSLCIITVLLATACSNEISNDDLIEPNNITSENEVDNKEEEELYMKSRLKAEEKVNYTFQNVTVHDPSVIKVDDTYYVFGSHLAAAKTTDLINWKLVADGANSNNILFDDVKLELGETFEWAETGTLWAPDVIQLEDGRFYMYYCACRGDSPLSNIGIAVSDNIEGPYEDLGIILKSGMPSSIPSENGDVYDATVHPNAVDPALFFDEDGRLWMVYGSYSGGIYILEMDVQTGFPLEEGYGKRLLGGNHLRIEGPYILYVEETGYYYLFLSYGGLSSDGAYNIRIARSENPDGPYVDVQGNDMTELRGAPGSFFDDTTASSMGTKILGNIKFNHIEGELGSIRNGYLSPGHNSAYYDEVENKYFLIFHTRFEKRGESHEVRVHQMYMNEDDWLVVSPYRYVGETMGQYTKEDVVGPYKYINQMTDISSFVKKSTEIFLNEDNTITGFVNGTWELKENNEINLTIANEIYKGIVTEQWDEFGQKNVMVFTALSDNGVSILGSGIYAVE